MNPHEQAAKDLVLILQKHKHQALYVGGCVRDKLLGKPTSDFDIATSATPEEIQQIFPKTIPVGIQFGIIVVVHHGFNFEVATFREDKDYVDGRHPSSVVKSTIDQDVKRRDFTINGLYYDPVSNKLHDLVEGEHDLKLKIIRAIGDPKKRFLEDRLRMIRAARYAAVLHFTIEQSTKNAIIAMASNVTQGVSVERIYQEFEKMHDKDSLYAALKILDDLNLLQELLPQLKQFNKQTIALNLSKLKSFKKQIPLILALCLLLDINHEEQLENLILYLKTSGSNRKIGKMFLTMQKHRTLSSLELAYLFSDPLANELLLVQSVQETQPETFIDDMRKKQSQLTKVIERIVHKDPIVSASDLLNHGIPKGPKIKEGMAFAMSYFANHPNLSKEAILAKTLDQIIAQG